MKPSIEKQRTSRGETPHWYLLAVFTAIQTMLSIDRSLPSVVSEPLKRTFHLNDSQLSLLIGLAFAVFFSVAGLLIGRAVDRFNRRNILIACVVMMSLATAATALATVYGHLLAARLIVGAGVAGCGPAMISILSDRFEPARRASALGILYMGLPIGYVLNFVAGGRLAVAYGWWAPFLAAGLFGLVLALVVLPSLREPARATTAIAARENVFTALGVLVRAPGMVRVLVGAVFLTGGSIGLTSFLSSLLIRSHGLPLDQAGWCVAASLGGGGLIGTPLGGTMTDRLSRRDLRWRVWWPVSMLLLSFATAGTALLTGSTALAVAMLFLWGVASSAVYGPVLALAQGLSPPEARGTLAAVYYLLGNLVGAAGMMALVGFVSDMLTPAFHADALRHTILMSLFSYLIGAALLASLSRRVEGLR